MKNGDEGLARRTFLKGCLAIAVPLALSGQSSSVFAEGSAISTQKGGDDGNTGEMGKRGQNVLKSLLRSPVTTNRLRPPGSVAEDRFAATCIRCGRCVEVCPYRCIIMLDIRSGLAAGTPLINVEEQPCYLCMKCVDVCPTGSLRPVSQVQTRMGRAEINRFHCTAWQDTTMCRTCYDKCPFKEKAIRLDQLRPVVDTEHCTGCGLCTHACPVSVVGGGKAINIEPLFLSASE